MNLLNEMYSGVGGLDNYDRAIEMINAAVDHHERNDNFDAIADIDSLVQFLKGQYHDFTPALENTVREIVADELGTEEEEEKKTWHPGSGKFPSREARAKDPWLVNKLQNRGMANYYGAKMKDKRIKGEEEESRLEKFKRERDEFWKEHNKRKQARKYGVSGPSGRRSRLGSRSRGRLTSSEEQEWLEKRQPWGDWEHENERILSRHADCPTCDGTGYHRGGLMKTGSWNCPDCKGSGKQLPSRFPQDELSPRGRDRLRGEEEENKTDWNKEVEEFRKRRKHYEPEGARSGRLGRSRRRPTGPSGNAFGLRFESFKSFLEKESETSDSE